MMRFFVHGFLWISSVLFGLILYPIKWMAYFKKSKKCPPIKDDLLLIPAIKLAELLRKRQISSKIIIETYINRVKEVNPILNAIVQDRFSDALLEATNVDIFLDETDLTEDELKTNYPLLGVPITIKETIALKGLSFNGGVKTKTPYIADFDNDAVKLIKNAGGIPLLVSNTPELCLNWETCNKLTGRTLNPYDTRRTCGGSSGGEAVLLSSGASVLGLGSDLCGSIRLPSNFCGIYGHKPTGNSISINGTIPYLKEKNDIWEYALTVGPLTRYACDLNLLFDVVLKPEVEDTFKTFDLIDIKSIKIFYMEFDGDAFMTHVIDREIVCKIQKVINQFKINGFETKKVKLKRMSDSVDLAFLPLLTISGLQTVFNNDRNLFGEILRTFIGCSNVEPTSILFQVLYTISRRLIDNKRQKNIMKEIEAFRNDINDLLGSDGVLLYPVFPTVAHFHGEIYSKTLDTSYMTIFNILGIPATSCPIGVDSNGLPIGLQVVANFRMDRLCFKIAEEIEREFGGWKQPPFSDNDEKV